MNEQEIQDLMNALYKSQAKVVTLKGEVERLQEENKELCKIIAEAELDRLDKEKLI